MTTSQYLPSIILTHYRTTRILTYSHTHKYTHTHIHTHARIHTYTQHQLVRTRTHKYTHTRVHCTSYTVIYTSYTRLHIHVHTYSVRRTKCFTYMQFQPFLSDGYVTPGRDWFPFLVAVFVFRRHLVKLSPYVHGVLQLVT